MDGSVEKRLVGSRESDCTGQRPSWFPWVINAPECDNDSADPIPLTARERSIGEAKPIPWWPLND